MAGAPHGPAGQGLESGPSPPPQPGDMGRPGSAGPMAGQGYGELVALGWAEAGSWAMGRVGEALGKAEQGQSDPSVSSGTRHLHPTPFPFEAAVILPTPSPFPPLPFT